MLGQLYEEVGRVRDAISVYRTILKDYPTLSLVEEHAPTYDQVRGRLQVLEASDRIPTRKSEFINYTVKDGLNYPVVQAIAVDGEYIWFGHLPESFLLRRGGDRIRDFHINRQANLPCGLSRFNKRTQQWTSYCKGSGLSCNLVTSIVVDNDSVWVGTHGGGLNRYIKTENRWTCYTEKDGLPYNYILSLATWKDELWIGLGRIRRGALAVYHKKKGEFNLMATKDKSKGYKERAPEKCVVVISPNEKEVWVAEFDVGLKRYDRKTQTWTTFQHKFNYETGEVEGIIDIENRISSLSQDGKTLWIGTYYSGKAAYIPPRGRKYFDESNGGVNSCGLEDGKWGYFSSEDGLISNCILATAVGRRYIWFGRTMVRLHVIGGVSCYDKHTHTWSNLSTEDGLVNGNVLSLAVDTDSVWIGTEAGVSRLMIEGP